MRLIVALAIALIVAACTNADSAPPTAMPPTEPPPPFTIQGPVDQQTAFAAGAWFYILEPATGELHTVRIDPSSAGIQPTSVGWADDTTLRLTDSDGGSYRLTLDGEVSHDDSGPSATFTPFDGVNSADGAWSATRTADGLALTEVSTGRVLDVPYTGPYEWAPDGHRLVVGGGWCGNGRIAIVDPDGAGVIPVTDGREVRGLVWYWRPDGGAFALDVFDPRFTLGLVDATTGELRRLAPIEPAVAPGEFVPLQWNPSGTRFLFRIHGGRDCSN